jgi:pimeloyl-ACP methyl ester carboxylesterase
MFRELPIATMARNTSHVFVLIPGSFSPPSFYEKLVPLLAADGFGVHVVELPSVTDGTKAATDMYADAAHINAMIGRLADEGKCVSLVANSYGGLPSTQAAEGLSRAERERDGKPGYLNGIVYLSAFLVPTGETIKSTMGEKLPQQEASPTGHLSMEADATGPYVFNHLESNAQMHYAQQLRCHSAQTFEDPLTYAGYNHVPAFYVLCSDDRVIPLELQKQMVAKAREKGTVVEEVDIYSDHCPMISHPKEVRDILSRFVRR